MAKSQDRGRSAQGPTEIPKAGWRDILLRVKDEIGKDHVSVVSAGVAFFGLLAIFPGIAALISLAGLVLDPSQVEAQLASATAILPQNAAQIITDQAKQVAGSSNTEVGIAAVFGLLLSLYSASKGMKTLMEGMNITYGEEERRGFIALNLTAFALTLFLIVGMLLALGSAIVLPAIMDFLGLSDTVKSLLIWGRWPIMALLTIFGLAVLNRYGPSRDEPRWQWVSVGAVTATLLWIAGSIAFAVYVQNFGSYNETYGTLGGVIVLLTWLWLSSFIVLLGAELNAEIEHQTSRDSTQGEPQPLGKRDAKVADTLGRTP